MNEMLLRHEKSIHTKRKRGRRAKKRREREKGGVVCCYRVVPAGRGLASRHEAVDGRGHALLTIALLLVFFSIFLLGPASQSRLQGIEIELNLECNALHCSAQAPPTSVGMRGGKKGGVWRTLRMSYTTYSNALHTPNIRIA